MPKLKDRTGEIACYYPSIDDLYLSKTKVVFSCKEDDAEKVGKISVHTKVSNLDNDILTYNYTVSAGRIIGKGAKVTWDLSEVTLGTYTITAMIDNGCDTCIMPKTETVVVKNCE